MRQHKKLFISGLTLTLCAVPLMASDYDNHWAKTAIDRCQARGIVKGYEDGTFRPSNKITRAEFAAILDRTLELPKSTGTTSFIDMMTNGDKWYAEPVQNVNALGLMYIEGMNFEPNKPMTREEAAFSLAKAYDLLTASEEVITFKDEDKISAWAKPSIRILASHQFMQGNPDGTINPKGTLTRAELVTMLDNINQSVENKEPELSPERTNQIDIIGAGVFINDKYIELPVKDNLITLDVPNLAKRFKPTDELTGMIIETSEKEAILISNYGQLESGKKYTFKEAEKQLGIIHEMAKQIGVNPYMVVNYVFGVEKLTIGSLMEDFELGVKGASSLEVEIDEKYELIRHIKTNEGLLDSFKIVMKIQ